MIRSPHPEQHLSHRSNWLRAAVLGANDGIVSTASLIVGVAAASAGKPEILVAGVAALFAGAMSMAAGEYVSVSSQADTERADIEIEKRALKANPAGELDELTDIYIERGLDPELARQVAVKLSERDTLAAHKRDELGITELAKARPLQAAGASALAFSVGAALPLASAFIAPMPHVVAVVSVASLASLALLGVVSASAGGARKPRAVIRVMFWGAFAMAITAAVGALFGATV
jgi:VIT1/CCC1 family predicted Fe2+/Mn2+ transporter